MTTTRAGGEGYGVRERSSTVDRKTLQQIYVRVCRDRGFTLDLHRACSLAAMIAGKHPLDIWMAMPSLDVMFAIAAGDHPAAHALPHTPTSTGALNEGD